MAPFQINAGRVELGRGFENRVGFFTVGSPTTSPASLLSGRKQAGPDGRASPATQAALFATTREAKDSRLKAEKTSIVV